MSLGSRLGHQVQDSITSPQDESLYQYQYEQNASVSASKTLNQPFKLYPGSLAQIRKHQKRSRLGWNASIFFCQGIPITIY